MLSADHIYDMDYREMIQFHLDCHADATIASIVYPLASASRFGIMDVDDRWRVRGFEEKPATPKTLARRPDRVLASMGIYVFKPDVLLDALVRDAANEAGKHDIGKNILPELVQRSATYAFNFGGSETGEPPYWQDVGTVDSYYAASMEWFASSGSVISKSARVHPAAEVIDSILMPGVRVGRGARIRRAILDENVCVPAGGRVGLVERPDSPFAVTPNGIVVVPANTIVPLIGHGGRRDTNIPAGNNSAAPRLYFDERLRMQAR